MLAQCARDEALTNSSRRLDPFLNPGIAKSKLSPVTTKFLNKEAMSEQRLTEQEIASLVKMRFGGSIQTAADELKMDLAEVQRIYRDNGGCVDCGLK